MKHDLEAFSREIVSLIKKSGDTGGSGDETSRSLACNGFFVPTRQIAVSPLAMEGVHDTVPSGDRKSEYSHSALMIVPSVPAATIDFCSSQASAVDARVPADWREILAELRRREPVDWLNAERWDDLLSDAENFLTRWGGVAYSLGWTSLDLFGVHPIAPAVRFDVMGLIPMLNGAEVLALTCQTATMRRTSGAVLTYRRQGRGNAILLSDVRI